MEVLGEGLKAVGAAVGTCAVWWGLSRIAGTAALTFLVWADKAPFDKAARFFERPQKRGF